MGASLSPRTPFPPRKSWTHLTALERCGKLYVLIRVHEILNPGHLDMVNHPVAHDAAKLIANAVFPPRVVVRPSGDPEINRCPKCGIDLGNRGERAKPFKCPSSISLFSPLLSLFLAGAAIFGLVFRLVGNRIQRFRVEVAPPDVPPSITGRTELKLNNWKHP
jgi:hypothetical protein